MGVEFGAGGLCGPCVAPFLLIGAMCIIGYGEKRAVCRAKAISQGKDAVVEAGCDGAAGATGELVHLSCNVSPQGIVPAELTINSTYFDVSVTGVCLGTESERYSCKETQRSESNRRRSSGSTTTYSYSLEWSSDPQDANNFRDRSKAENSCRVDGSLGDFSTQHVWDSNVPGSSKQTATSVKAGSWTISKGLGSISCGTKLNTTQASLTSGGTAASFQQLTDSSKFSFTDERLNGQPALIGDYRVKFVTNDWSRPQVTCLGQASSGNKLEEWVASDDWLCEGHSLYEVREGTLTVDQLIEVLESENVTLAWILRVVGFACFYLAFICFLGPLVFISELADWIPCVGDFVSDTMQCIIFAVACLPAAACCLVITGLCWVVVRPLIGIPCMIGAFLLIGCTGYFFHRSREEKKRQPRALPEDAAHGQPIYGAQPQFAKPQAMPYGAPVQQYPQPVAPYGQQPAYGQQLAYGQQPVYMAKADGTGAHGTAGWKH